MSKVKISRLEIPGKVLKVLEQCLKSRWSCDDVLGPLSNKESSNSATNVLCNKTHFFCLLAVGSQWTDCGKGRQASHTQLMGTWVKESPAPYGTQPLCLQACCYRWFNAEESQWLNHLFNSISQQASHLLAENTAENKYF